MGSSKEGIIIINGNSQIEYMNNEFISQRYNDIMKIGLGPQNKVQIQKLNCMKRLYKYIRQYYFCKNDRP